MNDFEIGDKVSFVHDSVEYVGEIENLYLAANIFGETDVPYATIDIGETCTGKIAHAPLHRLPKVM